MEVPVVLCFRHPVFNSVQKITSYPMIFNRTLATWLRSSYNSRDLTKKHCPKVKLSVDRQENWKTSELGWNTSARGAPDSESFSGKKFEFAMINLLGLVVHGLHFSGDNVFFSQMYMNIVQDFWNHYTSLGNCPPTSWWSFWDQLTKKKSRSIKMQK